MWFKNAQLYTVTLSAQHLKVLRDDPLFEETIQKKTFRPCMAQELTSIGFSPLFGRKVPAFTFTHAEHHFVKVTEENKMLPSSVIKMALEEETDKQEAELGRPLRKQEIQTLKSALVNKLLAQAFVSRRDMLVYINSKTGIVAVSASSAKRAELALAMLREAFDGTFPAKRLQPRCAVEDRMTSWIDKAELPPVFELGNDAVLKTADEAGGTVRVTREDLTSEEIKCHISAGKVITDLQLVYQNELSLVLSSDLTLKRLRPEDQFLEKNLPEKSADAVADMQATLILQGDLLTSVVTDIMRLFDCEGLQVAG